MAEQVDTCTWEVWEAPYVTVEAVEAPVRITPEIKRHLERCHERGILGFSWEPGSWNFGVLIRPEDS